MTILLGGIVVWCAAFLGGVVGFAYGLVSLPLLLLLGVPLPKVVVINLTIALMTRAVVIGRRYRDMNWLRVALLLIGSLPGIGIGMQIRNYVDVEAIKIGSGVLTLIAVAGLVYRQRHNRTGTANQSPRSVIVSVGLISGLLGVTTSLNGIAPALLLTGSHATARTVVADLAAFFVAGNALTLAALMMSGQFPLEKVWILLIAWVPIGFIGNYVGVSLGPLLPKLVFRRITLCVIILSGLVSTLTVFQ